MSANEKKSPDTTAWVVFAGLAANAACAFLIQAWMTFGFGDEVWRIPVPLCVALIVALDVFAIMFMILSYLLRGTGWPRAVVTLVFFFAIGVQVFAAELFADHKDWPVQVRAFSAVPALFLALAQEGVILWRTHRNDARIKRGAEPKLQPKSQPKSAAEAPKTQPPERPAKSPALPSLGPEATPRPTRRGRPVDPDDQGRRDRIASEVLERGGSKAAKESVASRAGVSVRAVENWIASYRSRYPDVGKIVPGNSGPEAPETGKTLVTEEVSA